MADTARGARELAALAKRLKDEGNGSLRKELLKGIYGAGKQAIPEVRRSATRMLPRRGGLAAQIAAQSFTSRASLSGSSVSVRLIGQGMKELGDIDAGRLRHPVFGNRDVWEAQSVTAGFFSGTMQAQAPSIRREIDKTMNDVAHRLTRSL